MKIEFLHHWHARHGVSRRTTLTAYLPRYAPVARRLAPLINLRNSLRGLAILGEKLTGISARRTLPAWRSDIHRASPPKQGGKEVVLFVDCFSRYFEPENARAARTVLEAGGYSVIEDASRRPLCCGRTFLSAGLVEPAREELSRFVHAFQSHAERGVPIIGIEPSCILTLRDELGVVVKGDSAASVGRQGALLEEFLVAESRRGTLKLPFQPNGATQAFLGQLDLAPTLSRRLGNRVWVKREDQQSVFSFKLRGAYNKMAHLSAAERAKGVIAAARAGDVRQPHRFELLRHGGIVRLRSGALRRLDANGGAQPSARRPLRAEGRPHRR